MHNSQRSIVWNYKSFTNRSTTTYNNISAADIKSFEFVVFFLSNILFFFRVVYIFYSVSFYSVLLDAENQRSGALIFSVLEIRKSKVKKFGFRISGDTA